MADIFISYASEDRAIAAVIAEHLRECGYTVWWDRDLVVGDDFHLSIAQALSDAFCAVVVWSTHSVDSPWVRDEARFAMRAHRLLPVLADGTEPEDIPLGFGGLHCLRMSTLSELTAALARLGVGTRATSRPASLTLLAATPVPPVSIGGRLAAMRRQRQRLCLAIGGVTVPIAVAIAIMVPAISIGVLGATILIAIILFGLSAMW